MEKPIVNVNATGITREYDVKYKIKVLKANIPFADQVAEENTKYIIRWNFNLDEEEVEIPANCILQFEGCSLSNGILIGNGTQIVAEKYAIFNGITISGTWNVPEITSDWFADAENDGLKNVFALQDEYVFNTITIEKGDYTVVRGDSAECLICKSNLKLIINGTISLAPTSQSRYYIISMAGISDVEVTGDGSIIGDRIDHDYETNALALGPKVLSTNASNTPNGIKLYIGDEVIIGTLAPSASIVDNVYWVRNDCVDGGIYTYIQCVLSGNSYVFKKVNSHEHGMGIDVRRSCRNISISRIKIQDCIGDGIYIGNSTTDLDVINYNVVVDGVTIDKCRRQGISITDIHNCSVKNCTITNIKGTNPQAAIDIEPNANHECVNVNIINNIFKDNLKGITCFVGGSRIENSFVKNIVIDNNIITCDFYGVYSHYTTENVTISNNDILCRYDAIHVDGDANLTKLVLLNNVIETTITSDDPDFISSMVAIFIWGAYIATVINNKVTTDAENLIFARNNSHIINNNFSGNSYLIPTRSNKGYIVFENNVVSVKGIVYDTSLHNKGGIAFYNNDIKVSDDTLLQGDITLGNNIIKCTSGEYKVLLVQYSVGSAVHVYGNEITNLSLRVTARYFNVVKNNVITFNNSYSQNTGSLLLCNGIFKENIVNIEYNENIASSVYVLYSGTDAHAHVENNIFNLNDNILQSVHRAESLSTFVGNTINGGSGLSKMINDPVGQFTEGSYRNYGTTAQRPDNLPRFPTTRLIEYFDTTLKKKIHGDFIDTTFVWREYDEAIAGVARQGNISKRPASSFIYVGFVYFDTDLGKPIYWNGTYWVDGAGSRITLGITYTLTNVSASNLQQPDEGSSYVTVLSADEGYALPTEITVKMGSAVLTAGTDYTYNNESGKVVILGTEGIGGVTEDIEIIANGI